MSITQFILLENNLEMSNLLLDKNQFKGKEIEFFKINRGGDITFHGPGQNGLSYN